MARARFQRTRGSIGYPSGGPNNGGDARVAGPLFEASEAAAPIAATLGLSQYGGPRHPVKGVARRPQPPGRLRSTGQPRAAL